MMGKGMKKKQRESDGAKKRISKKSLSIVLAAVIISSMMTLFMPLVAASVTSFMITPDTGTTCTVDAYSAVVNTTGFTSLTIAIPAGFGAVAPTTGGEELLRVDLWDSSGYYGYAIFTANNANPSKKVDVYTNIGGDIATTTQKIDYRPGGITSIVSPFGGPSEATLTLPTDSVNGSLVISLPASIVLTNVTININKFVRNPAIPGEYVFTADGMPETVPIVSCVTSFTITPDTGTTCTVDSYSVVVNTTGFTSLTIAIPAGFGAVAPTTGGVQIGRVDLWDSSGYYGYAIFTANNANPSKKVDVYTNIGGDIATTTQKIDYRPGGITSIVSPFGGPSEATLTLPTDSVNGSLVISFPASIVLTNVTININKFVQNPAIPGEYVFTADGVPETVPIVSCVTSFTITPDTGTTCTVDSYSAVVNTTGFTSLTIAIPAGFGAVAPTTGGVQIGRVDLWDSSGYYGYAIFTANNANPSKKVDVYTNIGGDIATTTQKIDYRPGGITSIVSPFGGPSEATLTLPTDSVNGSLVISFPASIVLTNVTININKFVQNPAIPGEYVFTADGVPETVQLSNNDSM